MPYDRVMKNLEETGRVILFSEDDPYNNNNQNESQKLKTDQQRALEWHDKINEILKKKEEEKKTSDKQQQ